MPSKNTRFLVTALALSTVVVTACAGARTRVLSRPEGQIAMESIAREESTAYEKGLDAASNHCDRLQKKLVVDGNHESAVADKNTVKVVIPFTCR